MKWRNSPYLFSVRDFEAFAIDLPKVIIHSNLLTDDVPKSRQIISLEVGLSRILILANWKSGSSDALSHFYSYPPVRRLIISVCIRTCNHLTALTSPHITYHPQLHRVANCCRDRQMIELTYRLLVEPGDSLDAWFRKYLMRKI